MEYSAAHSIIHVYDSERNALLWLVDTADFIHGATLVEIFEPLTIVSVELGPLPSEEMGGGAVVHRGGAEVPLPPNPGIDPLAGFAGTFIPQGSPGPQLGLTIETRGQGTLQLDSQVRLPNGEVVALGGGQVARFRGDGPFVHPLNVPILNLFGGGPVVLWNFVLSGPGRGGLHIKPAGFAVLPVLQAPITDPCQDAHLRYHATCVILMAERVNCDALRQALIDAENEHNAAKTELAKARTELKGAEDELAKTHEKVRKLTEKIEKELGDTGKLKTRDKLESSENFVGNGGNGIAFGSAAALLALSDSVAAKNGGTSLLAMVNELGQLKKDLETRTQAHVTAQARVAGLEARVSHLEAKEEDARKALKACEDRVEALLDVKLQIEENWELCLNELIVKGIVEELLFGTEMTLEIAKFLLGAFKEDAAAATDDATTGNSTHDE